MLVQSAAPPGIVASSLGQVWVCEKEVLQRGRVTASSASGSSPAESEGMASGSSWEVSSVEEDESVRAPLSPCSSASVASPMLGAATLPVLHADEAFLAMVVAQRKQLDAERIFSMQTANLDLARSHRVSEENASVCLQLLLVEAVRRDLEVESTVPQSRKLKKWDTIGAYLATAISYGRSVGECKVWRTEEMEWEF